VDKSMEIEEIELPLFEELPDDIDETWQHVAILGGMAGRPQGASFLAAARSYRWAAELVGTAAVHDGELWETINPALFLYRHAIELYLKTLFPGKWHDLKAQVEKLPGMFDDVPPAIMERLREFAGIDNGSGTAWRYPDAESPAHQHGAERMLDVPKMQRVMNAILDWLDHATLRLGK
jgi:hypothetical protein